ncbi:MAG: 2-oxoacid:acceptor oxidoreductase, gamma subunit, pyruvate/2-ketoisovalerate [uncultured bacterium]|nr:MAG: 2-oxoacid:acceptor oxidoreductase, gamma subunit, pyruvate/2-ketoisovalerate [uncultured bacterium]
MTEISNNSIVQILIAGEGGQGIQTIAKIIAEVAYKSGYQVVYMPHYGVEMRMGISLAYVQIALKDHPCYPKFEQADILVVTAKRDLDSIKKYISINTTVVNCINLNKILLENSLSQKTLNMLALGILSKELVKYNVKLSNKMINEQVVIELSHKSDLENNLKALKFGLLLEDNEYSLSLDNVTKDKLVIDINQDDKKIHKRNPLYCKGCGLCIEKCPVKALFWSTNKLNYISRPLPEVDINKCIACGICEQNCPDCAIEVKRK